MIEWRRPAGQRSVAGRVAATLREVATRPDRSIMGGLDLLLMHATALLDSSVVAHRPAWVEGSAMGASVAGGSLGHAIRFHARCRADDWLLDVQEAPVASRDRGRLYRDDGRLAVSVVRESSVQASSEGQG